MLLIQNIQNLMQGWTFDNHRFVVERDIQLFYASMDGTARSKHFWERRDRTTITGTHTNATGFISIATSRVMRVSGSLNAVVPSYSCANNVRRQRQLLQCTTRRSMVHTSEGRYSLG
jgi:hypothetical protein